MTINLETLEGLPSEFLSEMAALKNLFKKYDFLEEIETYNKAENLIDEIHKLCNNQKIVGYHFTRALEIKIRENGLLCRNGDEIRNQFLKDFENNLTINEINIIKSNWKLTFDDSDRKARDNKIYFNFTKKALNNSGGKTLMENYGGEQVYWPLYNIPELQSKIKQLGEPLVLECEIEAKKLNTFCLNSWGKIAVSSYHELINRNANKFDVDAYLREPVKSENINIIKYK